MQLGGYSSDSGSLVGWCLVEIDHADAEAWMQWPSPFLPTTHQREQHPSQSEPQKPPIRLIPSLGSY